MSSSRFPMTAPAVLAAIVALGGGPTPATAWVCALPDSATVMGEVARLGDVALGDIPPAAAKLLILSNGQPDTTVPVSRQAVLRCLVSAGLAAGVTFSGPLQCRVHFAGSRLDAAELSEAMRALLDPLVPPAQEGAPAPWYELEPPVGGVPVSGAWELQLRQLGWLMPGRNQMRFTITDELGTADLGADVVFHACEEVARVQRPVRRDEALQQDMFQWEWADLAEGRQGRLMGRQALTEVCAARPLNPGQYLQEQDVKPVPVVRSGDAVDLRIVRGSVEVTVKAMARREGSVGQTIPVRNELTGKLVNARVIRPGTVEWRR
jgi:flagella basal body P-ring formation protein FlgA